jgi:hypothetical protein
LPFSSVPVAITLQSCARLRSGVDQSGKLQWVVEATKAIQSAQHKPGRDNLSWGKFTQAAVMKRSLNDLG